MCQFQAPQVGEIQRWELPEHSNPKKNKTGGIKVTCIQINNFYGRVLVLWWLGNGLDRHVGDVVGHCNPPLFIYFCNICNVLDGKSEINRGTRVRWLNSLVR